MLHFMLVYYPRIFLLFYFIMVFILFILLIIKLKFNILEYLEYQPRINFLILHCYRTCTRVELRTSSWENAIKEIAKYVNE